MRGRWRWVAATVITAGCSGSASDPASDPATGAASPASSATSRELGAEMEAEVVAVDPVARTVTLREARGETAPGGTTTIPVEVSAMGSLRDYKTGDRVSVSCSRTAASPGRALSGCRSVTSIRRSR